MNIEYTLYRPLTWAETIDWVLCICVNALITGYVTSGCGSCTANVCVPLDVVCKWII